MVNDTLEVLRQNNMRTAFADNGTATWTVVYQSWRNSEDNGLWFSAFATKRLRGRAMAREDWDLHVGEGSPGFVQQYHPKRTTYQRFCGADSGVEPLVILQEHHGARPEMLPQVSEEFRLYHNLWARPDGKRLFKIEPDGNEYEAVRITANEIQIRTSLLRQYQAARQLDLLLFLDSVQFAAIPTGTDVSVVQESWNTPTQLLALWATDRGLSPDPCSVLRGKKVLAPPARRHAGIWPFDERDEAYPEFIIGEDENGRPIRALRVSVGRGDPRSVPGVRSVLRFLDDCNWKEPLAWTTVSRWWRCCWACPA